MRKKFYCQTWRSFLLTEYLGMFLCVILILFARLDIRHISEPGFSLRGVIMALIGGCMETNSIVFYEGSLWCGASTGVYRYCFETDEERWYPVDYAEYVK